MGTIPAVVAGAARRFGDAEALVDGPVWMTWRELREQALTNSGFFAANGVRPGDRVAVCAPHHRVLAALGAFAAGATLVPVNTRFTAAETADVLTRADARALVVVSDFLGRDRLAELRAGGHGCRDSSRPSSPASRGTRSTTPLPGSTSDRTTTATSSSPPAPARTP